MRILHAVIAASALLPISAQADDLIYTFWNAAYVRADFSPPASSELSDFRMDGFGLGGSVEVTDRVFVFGSYADVNDMSAGSNLSERTYGVGAGYAWPLAESFDVVGRLGYIHADASDGYYKLSDDAYAIGAGLRGRVLDSIEFEGGVQYADFSRTGNTTNYIISAQWYFVDQLALSGSAAFGDNVTTYTLGFRGTWGR